MTIAEAKQLRIVDYLASLGYHPQSVTSKQYWYLSPLRDERTPSFKVNDILWSWFWYSILHKKYIIPKQNQLSRPLERKIMLPLQLKKKTNHILWI